MITIGRRVYGLGAIGLGIVGLVFGAVSPDWLPVPPHLPAYHVLAYGCAALLIVGGAAVNAPPRAHRGAAVGGLVLAALFAALMVVFELPQALARPADWGGWQAVAESTAMALGGVLAYALAPGTGALRAASLARLARWAFGACLLVFGVSHFLYARFTASMVPAWLPPSQLFWAWATGVAQLAAGVAMLSGVRARLAAILLTVMYAIFGLLVHLPSVVAAPSSLDNWTENAINFILMGAAWTLADSLAKARTRRRGAGAL